MLLSFSPTKDPTARALMSPAIASAVLNHKEFFFQGGLPLCITSTIFLPTDTFFNLVLLTLTSFQQLSQAPTNMGSEDGATEYLQDVLDYTPLDPAGGHRPPPWITPSIALPDQPLLWTCLDKQYSITNNTTLSFCPGSLIAGSVKPYYVATPGAVRTNTMWVSISDSTVFIRALFAGSRGAFPGVVAFPDAILADLEPTHYSPLTWRNTFKLRTNPALPAEFPPDLSLTFTAHRDSVLAVGFGRDSHMSHTVRAPKRRQIALNYANNPTPPYIFSTSCVPRRGTSSRASGRPRTYSYPSN